MTADKLVLIAGALLSLLFSYLPALAKWYADKDGVVKRQIMAAWLLITTAGLFAISCVPALSDLAKQLDIVVQCTKQSAWQLIYLYLLAIAGNQVVFLISPKSKLNRKPPVTERPYVCDGE